MMVLVAQCSRQNIYEVTLPGLCQHLQVAVCTITGNIMQVVSGMGQVVSTEKLLFCVAFRCIGKIEILKDYE